MWDEFGEGSLGLVLLGFLVFILRIIGKSKDFK